MKADPVPDLHGAKIEMLVTRSGSTFVGAGLDLVLFSSSTHLRQAFRGNELGVNSTNTVFGSRFQGGHGRIGKGFSEDDVLLELIALVGVNDISVYPAEAFL